MDNADTHTQRYHAHHGQQDLAMPIKADSRAFRSFYWSSAEEEFLKELCVLCDSAFQTSTRNLKFSHRSLKSQSTGAESVSSKFHAPFNNEQCTAQNAMRSNRPCHRVTF